MPAAARSAHPRRRTRILLVVVLAAFINLPLVHSTWTSWRIDADGVERAVEVVGRDRVAGDGGEDGAAYWVTFRYPPEVDEQQQLYPARVDRETYERAGATRELEVRHLPGRPAAYQPAGEVTSNTGLVVTIAGDAALLVVVLMVWRFGGRRRPYLRMTAVGDVERCPPGPLLEQLDGTLYLVRGEVTAIEEGEIVLDVGNRDVYVVLDGHANPVGYQQPAQVRGLMIE